MKKNLIILVSIGLAAAVGISLITVRQWQANAAKIEASILRELSAKDLTEIMKSEAQADRPSVQALQKSEKRRKNFLKGLSEHMSIAAQARLDGFTEDEKYKLNVAYKKDIMLADMYQLKLSEGLGKLYTVPQNELDSVWKNKDSEKEFNELMSTLRDIRKEAKAAKGDTSELPQLAGEMLTKSKNKWAKTRLLSTRAKNDNEFFNSNAIQKRLQVIEAGILSADYMRKHYADKIRPTSEEIDKFIEENPQYSVAKKEKLAKDLYKRVKAGEDFAELAKKHSEDRGSSAGGGVYEDTRKGALWKEVEEAAIELKPGQVADGLIKSDLGFHIVQLISKKGDPESSDFRFSVRHLVIQYKFVEPGEAIPGVPRPFLTAKEIATAEVTKQKRNAFVKQIVAANPVSLPEDFEVELPEVKKKKEIKPDQESEEKKS